MMFAYLCLVSMVSIGLPIKQLALIVVMSRAGGKMRALNGIANHGYCFVLFHLNKPKVPLGPFLYRFSQAV